MSLRLREHVCACRPKYRNYMAILGHALMCERDDSMLHYTFPMLDVIEDEVAALYEYLLVCGRCYVRMRAALIGYRS